MTAAGSADGAGRGARRAKRAAKWLAGIVLVIALVGFLILPPVVRHFGERALTDLLGRTVTIERIRINPFALSLTVSGFDVAEADGQGSAFSVARLYANLQAESLIRGGPVLAELRIESPRAQLARLESGRHSWSDVVERLSAQPAEEAAEAEPARFSINNIRLIDGGAVFEDRLVDVRHEVSSLQIGLPFLSNLPSMVDLFVEPEVSALVNGRPLHIAGQTRPFSADRETALSLTLDDFDFTPYLGYLPVEDAFQIPEGRLTTRVELAFSQAEEGGPEVALKGRVDLADFRMLSADGKPLVRLPALALTLADVRPLAGAWHFGELELTAPEVDVVRFENGRLNFHNVAEAFGRGDETGGKEDAGAADNASRPSGKAAATTRGEPANGEVEKREGAPPGKPVFALDRALVTGGIVRFEDRAVEAPFRTELRDVAIEAKQLGTAAETVGEIAIRFASDAEEKARHNGRLRLAPFALDGQVVVENLLLARYSPYYAAALPGGQIRQGRIDATVNYRFKAAAATAGIDVLAESVAVREFALALADAKEPFATLERFTVKDVAVSAQSRSVSIGSLASSGGSLAVVKTRDGRFDVLDILGAAEARAAPAASPVEAGEKAGAAEPAPWTVAVGRLALDQWSVRYEDRTQDKSAVIAASAIKLTADGITTAPGTSTRFDFNARIDGRGTASVKGTIAFDPLKGDLQFDLRRVNLTLLQPYVAEQLNVAISRGNLTSRGNFAFQTGRDGALTGRFRGDVGLANFSSIDRNHDTVFLRWKALDFDNVDLRLSPLAISVDTVALDDFYTRLILDEQGELNLREIARPGNAEPQAEQPEPEGGPQTADGETKAELPPPEPAPPISVGKVLLTSGNIAFSDRFVRPNYDANLTGMGGEITNLSSDPSEIARIELHGKVNDNAPVSVTGEFNLFREDRYLDVAASVEDFELTQVSTYATKYVGYGIEKGKLSARLHYQIDDRVLTATNQVFLDQLTFGEKVDSPDALDLPVRLAVSLLKNRQGEINLNLPVSGSLDDPQFSIGGVVLRAIVNLVGKALTAPFALLGSVFGGSGGGEELSYVEFAPGRAQLEPEAEQKIGTLATALQDRPALKLEITGYADPRTDVDGLKNLILERRMKLAKLEESGDRQRPRPRLAEVVIGDEEYDELLERVYEDADFERPRNLIGLLKEIPPAEMKAMLLANIAIDETDVRNLAESRAEVVRSRLTEAAGVDPQRVFLIAPKVESQAPDGVSGRRAVFSLR